MSGAEVIYQYDQQTIIIQCNEYEKMKKISEKFANKIDSYLNNLLFLYDGRQIDLDLTFREQSNKEDKIRKKMNIIVYLKNTVIVRPNIANVQSKDVICPICKESCRICIIDYKIIFYECKNGHKINNIFLDEFNSTQLINESSIICSDCTDKNKFNSYEKKFYKCLTCEQNLCLLCEKKHNKDHITIDYDKRNYICKEHNDFYIAFCKKCKINLCMNCFSNHNKSHKLIEYKDIIPNDNKIEEEIKELRSNIFTFKQTITDIIGKLEIVKEKIEIFYQINYDILKNYVKQNKNYQTLQNINEISNNINLNNIKEIINNENISNKISDIIKIYDKMVTKDDKHDFIIKKSLNEEKTIEKAKSKEVKDNIDVKNSIKGLNKTKNNFNQKRGSTKELKVSRFIENNENKADIKKGDKAKKLDSNKKINKENKIQGKNKEVNYNINRRNTYSPNELKKIDIFKNKNKIDIKKEIKEVEKEHEKEDEKDEEETLNKNEIILKYKIGKYIKILNLFGEKFVSNNADNCTIKFADKILKIKDKIDIGNDYKNQNILEIKLIGINLRDMSYMFYKCENLHSLSNKSTLDTSKVKNMAYMFHGCRNLVSMSCISKWDTSSLEDMSYMFSECYALTKLPDISTWNTDNVIYMNNLFQDCVSLVSLPDISSWNTSSVIKMNDMFNGCSELKYLPENISEWNTSNVRDFSRMFRLCGKLEYLPDISQWDNSKVDFKYDMFAGCQNKIRIPPNFK